MTPCVAINQLHQFRAIHLAKIRVCRTDGVKTLATLLGHADTAVADSFEFCQCCVHRPEPTPRADHFGGFHVDQPASSHREKPKLFFAIAAGFNRRPIQDPAHVPVLDCSDVLNAF